MQKRSSDTMLNDLLIVIDESLSKKHMIDVNFIYGIFLPKNNKFIVCKEEKYQSSKDLCLLDFFTNEIISYSYVKFDDIVCYWHNCGKIYLDCLNDLGFCLPIINLLGKQCKDGKVSKKELSNLYCIVNEYIKENPNFIDELMENEKNKMI